VALARRLEALAVRHPVEQRPRHALQHRLSSHPIFVTISDHFFHTHIQFLYICS